MYEVKVIRKLTVSKIQKISVKNVACENIGISRAKAVYHLWKMTSTVCTCKINKNMWPYKKALS